MDAACGARTNGKATASLGALITRLADMQFRCACARRGAPGSGRNWAGTATAPPAVVRRRWRVRPLVTGTRARIAACFAGADPVGQRLMLWDAYARLAEGCGTTLWLGVGTWPTGIASWRSYRRVAPERGARVMGVVSSMMASGDA